MSRLQQFAQDEDLCQEVKDFLIERLKVMAINKVFNKEDTTAIAEANEVIESAFDELSYIFKARVKKEVINDAR